MKSLKRPALGFCVDGAKTYTEREQEQERGETVRETVTVAGEWSAGPGRTTYKTKMKLFVFFFL